MIAYHLLIRMLNKVVVFIDIYFLNQTCVTEVPSSNYSLNEDKNKARPTSSHRYNV